MDVKQFGIYAGQEVSLVTLTDGDCKAELISYGAALRSLWVPDREGRPVDVCLGYGTLEKYVSSDGCLGAVVGRWANRIAGAQFSLNGQTYHLPANEGENTLHGGAGYFGKVWEVKEATGNSVTFALDSPDGEEGFPGTVHVEVTYLLKDGALSVRYRAVSDADTVLNLTNHAYFALSGQGVGTVEEEVLTLRAERYTPFGPGNIPTGDIAPVAGTALDFRQATPLKERLAQLPGGLDHNFVLDGGAGAAAILTSPRTGITLTLTTDREGVQVYSAGGLSQRKGKAGASYGPYSGLCLETQHFPNAVNQPDFPTSTLRAGEVFESVTTFAFTAEGMEG